MLSAFDNIHSSLKSGKRGSESCVLYLHYRFTAAVLFFSCILVSSQVFVGEKISCTPRHSGDMSSSVWDNYCWSASTYSVSSAYSKSIGAGIPHPGIAASENNSEYQYRNFYQYIHIILFMQGICFYLPHAVWKKMEPRFISAISEAANKEEVIILQKEETIEKLSECVERHWGRSKSHALNYLGCEVLALTNLLVQAYLLNLFLYGKFFRLGELLATYYNADILSDPMEIFPLVTVCRFNHYGASGYIDVLDSLCVLPINALNGKIFLFLWIWYLLLLGMSFGSVSYLLLCWTFPSCRDLPSRFGSFVKGYGDTNEPYFRLATSGDFGDWFVLSSLRKDVEESVFCRMIEKLFSNIGEEEKEEA